MNKMISGVAASALLSSFQPALAACGDGLPLAPAKLVTTISKAAGLAKGEFEKTADFEARGQLAMRAVAGHRFEEPMHPNFASYDADKEVLTLPSYPFTLLLAPGGQRVYNAVVLGKRDWSEGPVVGRNGFGTEVSYTIYHDDRIAVAAGVKLEYAGQDKLKIAPADAQSLIKNIKLRMVGNPTAPFVFEDRSKDEATVGSPAEWRRYTRALVIDLDCAVLVDGRNGKVLAELRKARR